MAAPPAGRLNSGLRRLNRELELLHAEGNSGIRARYAPIPEGDNALAVWDILLNVPDGIYKDYTLAAQMRFPQNYPFSPPSFRFITQMFHPNIYENGMVCISILHTDSDDPTATAYDNCTWTPSQNVRTVCLSIMSLLNAPNIFSPANIEASNLFRDDPEAYKTRVLERLEKFQVRAKL